MPFEVHTLYFKIKLNINNKITSYLPMKSFNVGSQIHKWVEFIPSSCQTPALGHVGPPVMF